MSSGRRWREASAATLLAVAVAAGARAQDGAPTLLLPLGADARVLLGERRPQRVADLVAPDGRAAGGAPRLRQQLGLDLSPAIDAVLGFANRHGLPLRQQLDEEGDDLVGVQAAIGVGADLPAVSFHLGDRPVEPLGAFYSGARGFRCALVWPVERFTLRLEAGEDSEFGYYGIAGLQWLHPRLPLAAGLGVPVNLRDAEGDVGLIMQLRMRLD